MSQRNHAAIKTIILSAHADRLFVAEAKKLGVKVYVSKSKVGDALIKAVEAAVKGEEFFVSEWCWNVESGLFERSICTLPHAQKR